MGKVEYAQTGGVQALSFIGDIRYTLGPSLDRFLSKLCAGPAPGGFIIDLTRAESLDSTSLGLLARIAKWLQQQNAPKASLFSSNQDIDDLLLSVGFDEVFDIVHAEINPAGQARLLPLELDQSEEELRHTLLEAHRTLMALNENNRKEFQDLVKMLEAQAKPQGA